MPIRRAAAPITVQHVWDAIRSSVSQRQMPDTRKIVKYLQRSDNCSEVQAELYIQQALQDGLIVALQKVTKSSKGDLVESFKIPSNDLPDLDGKDWYCFECHLGGDVNTCDKCFRVFHTDCIPSGRKKFDEFKKPNLLYELAAKAPKEANNSKNSQNSFMSNSSNSSISQGSQNIEEPEDSHNSLRELLNNNRFILNGSLENVNYDENLCSICNISKIDNNCNLEKAELNYLLKFVIHRIQSWLPTVVTNTMAPIERPEWLTEKELAWRANQLFFEHRDMSVIEVNLNNESYEKLYEFLADVLTIQHNIAIFHGIESQEYGAAELMVRDCFHDLTEVRLCPDCYKHSNEKINAKWFCLPCRVPHKLVWAKQKGYPYWPAKIIRETGSQIDVRFFGGKYERSLLQKQFVKPIETPQSRLQIKSSSAFNKAVDELKYHQRLLANPDELEQVVSTAKPVRLRNIMKKISPLKSTPSPRNVSSNNKKPSMSTSSSFTSTDDVYQFEEASPAATEKLTLTHIRTKRRSSFYDGSPVKKKKSLDEPETSANVSEVANTSSSVIHISDGDEDDEFSFRENNYPTETMETKFSSYNGSYAQVSSSTENYRGPDNVSVKTQENGLQQLDHPYSDSVEKMRRRLEGFTDKKEIIRCAMECMQTEIDKITNGHNDHLKRLFETHNAQISETKKKQWCYNCEQDAIYHCCWNTAYCSQTCQQQHWQAEHKKVCRRKH